MKKLAPTLQKLAAGLAQDLKKEVHIT